MKTLTFQVLDQKTFCWLECTYETESILRNRLMRVEMTVDKQNFSLDIADLRTEHPLLYKEIANAMANNAESYYEETKEVEHA